MSRATGEEEPPGAWQFSGTSEKRTRVSRRGVYLPPARLLLKTKLSAISPMRGEFAPGPSRVIPKASNWRTCVPACAAGARAPGMSSAVAAATAISVGLLVSIVWTSISTNTGAGLMSR